MRTDLLALIADLGPRIPDEHHNMNTWFAGGELGSRLGECGTSGCRIGWALALLPQLRQTGLHIAAEHVKTGFGPNIQRQPRINVFGPTDAPHRQLTATLTSFAAVAHALDITTEEAEWLFGEEYDEGGSVGNNSKEAVTARIREFIADRSVAARDPR